MTEFNITCKSTYMADDGYLWTVSHIHLFNREIFFSLKIYVMSCSGTLCGKWDNSKEKPFS